MQRSLEDIFFFYIHEHIHYGLQYNYLKFQNKKNNKLHSNFKKKELDK